MAITFLLIVAALLVAGISLIIRGKRGRVIDDHPICRKCGFDLIGLPSDVHRCSECGADLRERRAIVQGRRVRRTGLIAGGATLVIVSLALVGVPAYYIVNQSGLTQYKPVWWLIHDARSEALLTRSTALRELIRRTQKGELSKSSMLRVADEGLRQQQSENKWSPEWGDLIEITRSRNVLDDERWQRYMRQAIRATLTVRPIVRQGDPIPYRVNWDCRVSKNGVAVILDEQSNVDGDTDRVIFRVGSTATRVPGNRPGQHISGTRNPDELKLGQHTLTVTVFVSVHESISPSSKRLHQYSLPITATLTLVPAGQSLVTGIVDSTVAPAIETGITARLDRSRTKPEHIFGEIRIGRSRYPLAFEVFAREGTREWRLTSIALPAEQMTTHTLLEDLKGIQDDKVDLIFRPSADVARRTVEMTQYWNGTIEIKDVPIGAK